MRRQNNRLVLEALRKAGEPMTAYEVIGALRPHGISAPSTVYRALEQLVHSGQVHRLESINSFIACDQPAHQEDVAFAICDGCGDVSELSHRRLAGMMRTLADMASLKVRGRSTIEIHGICARCAEQEEDRA